MSQFKCVLAESSVLKLWKSSCSLCSEKYKFVFILRNEFCLTLSLLRHVLTMWLINWSYEMKTWDDQSYDEDSLLYRSRSNVSSGIGSNFTRN